MSHSHGNEHVEITHLLAGLTRRLLVETKRLHRAALIVERMGRLDSVDGQLVGLDAYRECIREIVVCTQAVQVEAERLWVQVRNMTGEGDDDDVEQDDKKSRHDKA